MFHQILSKNSFIVVSIAVWLFFLFSCTGKAPELEYALKQAGINRKELEQVLRHYEKDSLKLQAAEFLICNMPYQVAYHDTLKDPAGIPVDFKLMNIFKNGGIDSLYTCGYTVKRVKRRDIETVSASYLIDNIDRAFEVWHRPWARNLSFDAFCRYILPYRISNEPLSSMRGMMQCKFLPTLDSARVIFPVDACMLLSERHKGCGFFSCISFYRTDG